jgi:hypothetical protein
VTAIASARTLLAHAVDYAGTFPPAALRLHAAVANYVREREGRDAWLLGRLVVAADSLDEVASVLSARANRDHELSVIVSSNPADAASQLERVSLFNERLSGRGRVASVEFSLAEAAAVPLLASRVPESVEAFFEVPLEMPLAARLDAIFKAGAAAKARTGGITAAAIPSPSSLAQFLHGCAERHVRFKATAGLHHAIRSCYSLTYERDSDTAVMHGFLNVAVGAALAHAGAHPGEIADALTESSATAFDFGAEGLVYRGAAIPLTDLAHTRRDFFRSFGSCAFREPVEELARLHLV